VGVFYDHILSDFCPDLYRWLERHKTIRGVAEALAFAVLLVVVAVGFIAYQAIDESGWIRHDHDTPVWIQGDWLVSEYRVCQMRTKTVPTQRKDLDSLDKLPRLFCGKDMNGLFDFQRETALISPPPDTEAPPPGNMYLFGVTANDLDRDFHVLPVRYFGRIDRQDKWVISWRCQRNSNSLTCKALD
jgi:hypothetical protein